VGDEAGGIVQTTDGSYIVAAYSHSESGNVLWQKCGGYALPEGITNTTDGGFAVAGVSYKNGSDAFFIAKYDSVGNTQWQKEYGGSADDHGKAIIQTQDGNLVAVGYSNSNDGDVWGITPNFWMGNAYFGWMMKLNIANGDTLFSKMGFGPQFMVNIKEMLNGDLLTAGEISGDGLLAGYDSNGISATANIYGLPNAGEGFANFCSDGVGDWLLTGAKKGANCNPNTYDGWIVHIDAIGSEYWNKCYGLPNIDYTRRILPDPRNNGQYYVAGYHYTANGWIGAWLFKIDANNNGQMLWQENYGNGTWTEFKDAIIDNDGNLVLVGVTQDSTIPGYLGGNDAWVIKLSDPSVVDAKDLPIKPFKIEKLTDNSYQITTAKPTTLTLTDAIGKELKQYNTNNGQATIDLSNYAQGVYFIAANGYKTIKIVR
jgi:hypothetical protein